MRKNKIIIIIFLFLVISIPSTSLSTSINDIEKDDLKNEEINDNEPLQKKALVWGHVKIKAEHHEPVKLAVLTFIDGEDNYWIKFSGLIGGYYFIILPYGDYTVFTRWFIFANTTSVTVDLRIQNHNFILY